MTENKVEIDKVEDEVARHQETVMVSNGDSSMQTHPDLFQVAEIPETPEEE